MARNSLETFALGVASEWGPLSSELVDACRKRLEELLQAAATEEWLDGLLRDAPLHRELWRDPACGFMLLAHTEPEGIYRPPHDHGRGWVMYGIIRGISEMGTYSRVSQVDGQVKLVKRNSTLVRAGEVQVYLPGDIHDTRCISGPSLLLRFTERDLKKEGHEAHMVTRYVQKDSDWVPEAP